MVKIEIQGETYYVDNKLTALWEKNSLANMNKYNKDRLYIVDGMERSGKTTWAIQQMGALDPEAFKDIPTFLSRICFSPKEFHKRLREVKNGVIIFDEAFRGFSNRSALSKTNKQLNQALMEMGQNNNIVFIVLPSFFMLDIYPAMIRSIGLFHIQEDKKNRKLRAWKGFNYEDKNRIHKIGTKKGWRYLPTRFMGRFYGKFPGGDEYYKAYLKKKSEAFQDMFQEQEKDSRYMLQRNILIKYLVDKENLSHHKAEVRLKELGIQLSRSGVGKILKNMGKNKESNE